MTNLYPIYTDKSLIMILFDRISFYLILTKIPCYFDYSYIKHERRTDMLLFSFKSNSIVYKASWVIYSSYKDSKESNILNPSLAKDDSSALNSNFII